MNRSLNILLIRRLLNRTAVNVKVNNRNLSYARKFENIEKTCISFISPRNYCTEPNKSRFYGDSELLDEELYSKVTKGDPELENRVKVLLMEMETLQLDEALVPKKMTEREWEEYLHLGGYFQRLRYLEYLAKNEFKTANAKSKKIRKAEAYQSVLKEVNLPDHLKYQLGKNAMFMKINKIQISTALNLRVLGADHFDNRIVFDMGYERYMTRRQLKECAKQLLYTFADNRMHYNPFYFHLCNYPQDTLLDNNMDRFFSSSLEAFPMSIHKESYLDVFDRDRLVYLTPDSPYDMKFDPDAVYIIGAFIDTGTKLPVSFAKAKAEKIRTAKFPLDQYLKWKQGNKSLTLNQVVNIVADHIYYRSWTKAFKNVPRRLIDMFDEEDMRDFRSSSRYPDEKKEVRN